jgi:hypothetical protein
MQVFDRIDSGAPWLGRLTTIVQPLLQAQDWRVALDARAEGLRNHRGLPLRFVAQAELPPDTAYEAFISDTGKVPTRDNLHDFFNAVIWLAHPQIKQVLNAVQATELAQQVGQIRGKVRDGVTLFDESAALFACSDERLVDALRDHRWTELFVEWREAFGTTYKVFLFGHALLEKLTAPYKAITAHAWVVMVEPAFFTLSEREQRACLDARLAQELKHGLVPADFTPLPVLGVPGWAAGQDEAYYRDQAVFRPKRKTGGNAISETSGEAQQ